MKRCVCACACCAMCPSHSCMVQCAFLFHRLSEQACDEGAARGFSLLSFSISNALFNITRESYNLVRCYGRWSTSLAAIHISVFVFFLFLWPVSNSHAHHVSKRCKKRRKSDDDEGKETEGKVSNKKMRYVFDLYIIHCSYWLIH